MDNDLKFFDKFNDSEKNTLNKLVEELKHSKIISQVILIDLTYLNESFGMCNATIIKNTVINYLNSLDFILYFRVQAGKIVLFMKREFTTNEKTNLDKRIIESCENLKNLTRKVVYFNDKLSHEVGPFDFSNINMLFNKALIIEHKLSQFRAIIQRKLGILEFTYDNLVVSNIWLDIDKSKKKIDIDIKKNPSETFRIVKSSVYLTNAYSSLYSNNNNKNEDSIDVVYYNLVLYFLWYEIQKLMLIGFKEEKITSMINRENNDPSFNLANNEIIIWFNSTIKPLYNYFDSKKLNDAIEIEKLMIDLKENTSKKDLKNIISKIDNFVSSINIEGVFSLPLSNLKPSELSLKFFSRLLSINFSDFEKLDNSLFRWKNLKIFKDNYFIVSDGGEVNYLLSGFRFINSKSLRENSKNYFHMAFLEIDGFNAFNTYLFGTDCDSIYKQIIDSFYENANNYFFKYSNLFKTFSLGVAGDEFFISFMSSKPLTNSQLNVIKNYLKDVQRNILKITSKGKFIATNKIKINYKNGELVFRQVLSAKEGFFSSFNLKVAKIGVSGILHSNILFSDEKFIEMYNLLDSQMKNLKKNNYKGSLVEFFDDKKNIDSKLYAKL